jgi:ATP-binding cassette subfamily B protein
MQSPSGQIQQPQSNHHLFALLWHFRHRLLLGLLLMTLTVLIQLALPKALAYFIDHIRQPDPAVLNQLALLMLLVVLLQAAAGAARYYIFESTGYMLVTQVRRQLYSAMLAQRVAFFDKHHVGELTSRLAADVEVLHDTLTMGMALSLRSALVFIGALVMLLSISWSLSLVLLLFVPLALGLGHWAGRQIRTRSEHMQSAQADCSKVAQEYFSHIKLVKAFNQHHYARDKYRQVSQQSLDISLGNTRIFAGFQGLSLFITFLALLATLWFGAGLIGNGVLSTGELTSFVLYAGMLASSGGTISDFWSEWMRTLGATRQIFRLIDETPAAQTGSIPALSGQLCFENVSFVYPQRPGQQALSQLSFSIQPGSTVALAGASGAGKSTIVNLLLGFYLPSEGKVCFDGQPLPTLDIKALRRQMAVVEQEPSLFCGSIFENIAFAVPERQVTLAEVQAAAQQACADDFIRSFPAGYHTQVGEQGMQLSGGQKQRIAIARALLRDPKILILDEATSALDADSERQVQKALEVLMQGRTTIIIAHRFSTITKADQVLVLEQGQLLQQGSPQQLLLQQDGRFYQLMKNQLQLSSFSQVEEAGRAVPA